MSSSSLDVRLASSHHHACHGACLLQGGGGPGGGGNGGNKPCQLSDVFKLDEATGKHDFTKAHIKGCVKWQCQPQSSGTGDRVLTILHPGHVHGCGART